MNDNHDKQAEREIRRIVAAMYKILRGEKQANVITALGSVVTDIIQEIHPNDRTQQLVTAAEFSRCLLAAVMDCDVSAVQMTTPYDKPPGVTTQ